MLTNSSSRREKKKKKPRFVVFADFYSVQAFSLHCWFSSVQLLNHVQLFATPWIAAHQASQATNHCGAGNWCTKSALTICMSPLQHTTAPTSANYHLQAQTSLFCVGTKLKSTWMSCLFNIIKGKWTHNLPVKLFPYSRFLMVYAQSLRRIQLFVTPWTVARQAPLSMQFSQQEYWSGWPCPSAGDLPNLGIEPRSPALQANSLPSEPSGKLFLW